MLPLTLGANIGTTVTGLLASLVSGNVDALQVALAHLFFNISGIIIWYPIPFMRKVPLEGARALGRWTRRSRAIPPIYVITVFFVIPLLLLGLSELFQQNTVGYTVLGALICVFVAHTSSNVSYGGGGDRRDVRSAWRGSINAMKWKSARRLFPRI